MNKYETVIVITDKINKEKTNKVIKKIKKFMKKNGEIIETKDIGMRKLAYDIKKCQYGYYFQMVFKAEPEIVYELEGTYRITDEILKFITIKIEKCD